jgi:N-acetylglutamate synthase-like GNAT family acetyltransferase
MIEIAFLADHLETVPILAHWFQTQWPAYYAERIPTDIAQDFYAEANRSSVPVRLVAFIDSELAGTISLRERALQALPEYRPGLGGLFVVERYRRRGLGTELVQAGMNEARKQGYAKIFAATVSAGGILERLGWKLVQEVSHGNEQSRLYSCDFGT